MGDKIEKGKNTQKHHKKEKMGKRENPQKKRYTTLRYTIILDKTCT